MTTPIQRETAKAPGVSPGNKPRLYKTEGLVLRAVSLGEADRLVTVLTPSLGKLRATVRGARRIKSRLGGHVDVLTRVQLGLAQGRTLDVITGAESLESFRHLKSDLDRVAQALYLMELADALMPEGAPHPEAYTLLLASLRLLDGPGEPAFVPRYVELRLLMETGFQPELRHCLACHKELAPEHHRYAPHLGGVVCDTCQVTQGPVLPLSVAALKVLRFYAAHNAAEAGRVALGSGLAGELEGLMAASIHHTLERDVRSSGFINELRRLRTGGMRWPA
jgi:DNA repair protein RecO (recombination protein O)